MGGGELLRGIMTAANPLAIRPVWYTRDLDVAAGGAAGAPLQTTFTFDDTAWFLVTNCLVYPYTSVTDANPILGTTTNGRFTIQLEFPTFRKKFNRLQGAGIGVFPVGLNSCSDWPEYELVAPNETVTVYATTSLAATQQLLSVTLQGVEFVFP